MKMVRVEMASMMVLRALFSQPNVSLGTNGAVKQGGKAACSVSWWSTVAWHVLSGQHLKGLHVAHVGQ
jgi:hypothetical protein